MTEDRLNAAHGTRHGGAAGPQRLATRLGALALADVLVAGMAWAIVASTGGGARTGGVVVHAAAIKPLADPPAFASQLPALRTRRKVHAKRHPARAAGSSTLTASANGAAPAAATRTS